MDEEEARVEIHTTVDILIARLEDHPDEFFNADKLPLLDAKDCLSGCKWRRLVAHLCNPTTTGLFTLDEKQRFSHALDIKMRAALDGLIIKALVGDEPFDLGDKESMQGAKAAMLSNAQGILGPGTWKNSGNVQYNAHTGQAINTTTGQAIADQHFRLEMERQKREYEAQQQAGIANSQPFGPYSHMEPSLSKGKLSMFKKLFP